MLVISVVSVGVMCVATQKEGGAVVVSDSLVVVLSCGVASCQHEMPAISNTATAEGRNATRLDHCCLLESGPVSRQSSDRRRAGQARAAAMGRVISGGWDGLGGFPCRRRIRPLETTWFRLRWRARINRHPGAWNSVEWTFEHRESEDVGVTGGRSRLRVARDEDELLAEACLSAVVTAMIDAMVKS